MIKILFLSLFLAVLAGHPFVFIFAQNEGNSPSSGFFSAIFKGFIGLYRGFFGLSRGWYSLGQNIWDFKLKPYLLGTSEGSLNIGVKEQIPGIRKEFEKEINELKAEIPEAVKFLWQKGEEIINKNKFKIK